MKLGPQDIKWEESNSDKFHQAKNQVTLTKNELKGMKYLAVHLYPDDTVEITTSNNWPDPTAKGDAWYDKIKNKGIKMFTKTLIKRTLESNSDVPNTPPTAKQDCSDVVHISVSFDGTGNNKGTVANSC